MSDKIHLNAEPRSDSGKGASRRLRRQGMVPAIVYGGDDAPQAINLDSNQFFHQLENEAIYTQLIDLQVGKDTEEVILRDLQRHPYKAIILHADFFRVDKKKVLHITVPIHVSNGEECLGVRTEGGMLTQTVSEVEIIALPKDLPEYLEIDVENLALGESLHLSDIKMPKGVEIAAFAHGGDEEEEHEHDIGVISVIKTRAEEEISDEAPEAPETESEMGGDDNDAEDGDDKSDD